MRFVFIIFIFQAEKMENRLHAEHVQKTIYETHVFFIEFYHRHRQQPHLRSE